MGICFLGIFDEAENLPPMENVSVGSEMRYMRFNGPVSDGALANRTFNRNSICLGEFPAEMTKSICKPKRLNLIKPTNFYRNKEVARTFLPKNAVCEYIYPLTIRPIFMREINACGFAYH